MKGMKVAERMKRDERDAEQVVAVHECVSLQLPQGASVRLGGAIVDPCHGWEILRPCR